MLRIQEIGGGGTALYPAIAVSGITVISFLGSLLGYLEITNDILFVLGLFLLLACSLYFAVNRRSISGLSIGTQLPLLYFLAGCVVLAFLMEGRFLYSWDDFTHWGTIARIISEEQRLPMEGDLLSHTSYPPGCAIFISFFANIMGNNAGVYLFAQAVMLLAFLVSLFSVAQKLWAHIIIVPVVALLIQYNIKLEMLSVDNVLAGAAIAAIMICFSDRERRYYKSFPALALVLSALVLIKNSGLFLAILILGFAVYLQLSRRKVFHWHTLYLLIPFVILVMWEAYTKQAFTSTAKHDMSLNYYKDMLEHKQLSGIQTTIGIILPLIFKPSYNHALYLIPGYIALFPVVGKNKKYRRIFCFAGILFIVYEIGVLLMYMFSMSTSEVIYQNGADYYRYNGTIVAVLAAILFYLVCVTLQYRYKSMRGRIGASIVGCLVFYLAMWSLGRMYAPIRTIEYRAAKNDAVLYLQEVAEKNDANPGMNSYIIVANEEDSETYNRIAATYYLRTDAVTCFEDEAAARAELEKQPWATYINLHTHEMESAKETVGVDLYTQTIGKEYSNILDQAGYRENMRYSRSSGKHVIAAGLDLTGQFMVSAGDVVRFKKVVWYPTEENDGLCAMYWFALDKEYLDKVEVTRKENLEAWNPVYDDDGNIIQITVPETIDSLVYLQIACQDIGSTSVITVNEEIPE